MISVPTEIERYFNCHSLRSDLLLLRARCDGKDYLSESRCLIYRRALANNRLDFRAMDNANNRKESTMTTRPLRFGIWALVHGSRAAHQDPEEPYDASWERNRDLVLAAEELGYDSTLIAQHTINPASGGSRSARGLERRGSDRGADQAHRDHRRHQAVSLSPRGAGQAGARDREHQPRPVRDQSRQCLEPSGTGEGRHRLSRARRALRLRPRMDHRSCRA